MTRYREGAARRFVGLVAVAGVLALVAGGCGGTSAPAAAPTTSAGVPGPSVVGAWRYDELYPGGTYDSGTITFGGDGRAGPYRVANFYNIEYAGTYVMNGDELITVGAKDWKGRFEGPSRLAGSWIHEGTTESWAAARVVTKP